MRPLASRAPACKGVYPSILPAPSTVADLIHIGSVWSSDRSAQGSNI